MTLRVPTLAILIVSGLALAGCSGGGDDSTSSTTAPPTSVTPTTVPPVTTPDVHTVTSITTISGTTSTVTHTTTVTDTGTSSQPTGPAPVIENVVIVPGVNSARVDYEVSSEVGGLVSGVEYDLASRTTYSFSSPEQVDEGAHRVTLSGLTSCTPYKLRVYARDANATVVRTNDKLFSTLAGPAPTVTNIAVDRDSITDVSMKVTWTVAGSPDVKSKVIYGISTLDKVSAELSGIGDKEVVLTGLSGGQSYRYQIVVTSPCGSHTFPAAPNLQKSAIVKVVTINENAAVSGATNAFSPGSSLAGDLQVKKSERYVFEIVNDDSPSTGGAVTHEFHLETASGASMGYSSGDISATSPNNKYHFPIGVHFDTIGTATYKMKCIHHPSMVGDITVTA